MARMQTHPARILATLCALLGACDGSGGAPAAASTPVPAPVRPAAVATPAAERTRTSARAELAALVDLGRLDEAREAIERLAEAPGGGDAEALVLRARAQSLAERRVEALRLCEEARAKAPRDPEVYATAAEVYAANGRYDGAWMEIKDGEAACGEAPELLRAKGVVWISRENGAEKGLAQLLEARGKDPELRYCVRPLSQAYQLVAKLRAAAKDAEGARAHAEAALALVPHEVDARRLAAECRAATADFAGATALLEGLVLEGEPLRAELALTHKKAGIAALLAHDRPRALDCFAAARAHGLTDEELSTGTRLLAEESLARTRAGVEAYERGELAEAEAAFREALRYEPGSVAAENHLAVVLAQRGAYDEAILLWRKVLDTAREEKLELPEPVHLNLARTQSARGDAEGARLTCEEYLDREPAGEWAEGTRALLADLAAGDRTATPR